MVRKELYRPASWRKYKIKLLILAFFSQALILQAATLNGIRIHENPEATRVVLDLSGKAAYKYFRLEEPYRAVFDLKGTTASTKLVLPLAESSSKLLKLIRSGKRDKGLRIVLETKKKTKVRSFSLQPIPPHTDRIVIDLYPDKPLKKKVVKERKKAARRNVVVAIDAGHGGEDPGALGPRGIQEKQVVLQISKKLRAEIEKKKGFKGLLVRKGDYYLAHRKRTEFARENGADLFVSIHADAFTSSKVSGASIYTLSGGGAESEMGRFLANRANESDLFSGAGTISIKGRADDVAKTIVDMIMDGKTLFSVKAGNAVLSRLQQATKLHKKRVEQAGFLVLKTSDIPSILVETGFISNPREARRLSQKDHQNRLSKAIAEGIWDFFYENPPPGTLVASLSNEVTYQVQRGDTLSGIGQEFGVSSKAIKERNALRTSKIKIGQTLIIPRRISSQRGA